MRRLLAPIIHGTIRRNGVVVDNINIEISSGMACFLQIVKWPENESRERVAVSPGNPINYFRTWHHLQHPPPEIAFSPGLHARTKQVLHALQIRKNIALLLTLLLLHATYKHKYCLKLSWDEPSQ
jgi:hypothetical protein